MNNIDLDKKYNIGKKNKRKCCYCDFYLDNGQENECLLTWEYCYHTVDKCEFINDDGTINKSNLEKSNL